MYYRIILSTIFCISILNCKSQIFGDKNIVTQSFEVSNITGIKIDLYAEISIDCKKKEGITITTDSNLIPLIKRDIINGILHLDQIKWIEPSSNTKIIIGSPYLQQIESNTHGVTKVINFNNSHLIINAPVGSITVEGNVNDLSIVTEQANINTTALKTSNAKVSISGWGNVNVNVQDRLYTDIVNEGSFSSVTEPKIIAGNAEEIFRKNYIKQNTTLIYINFKLKNNSITKKRLRVEGPKPDGTCFGYGFTMSPFSVRGEYWTIGTRVYEVKSSGEEILLCTISKQNEGKIIKFF